MPRILRLLSVLLCLSLSAADTAWSQTSKSGSAAALVAAGKGNFEFNCASCHPSTSGQNTFGPSLFGVVGRKSGTANGYAYTPAYIEAGAKGVIWTQSNLFGFLANPTAFLNQKLGHPAVTLMTGGFPDATLRRSIIGYLKTLK